MQMNRFGQFIPAGAATWLNARSAQLALTCPFSPAAADEDAIAAERFPHAPYRDSRTGCFEAAWVGHVAESDFREQGSSGGLVSWTASELLRRGLVDGVAHVVGLPRGNGDEPFFGYRISRSEAEIRAGSRSRYYPVEMSAVLGEMRERPGRYAVVGIPCFIKAVHLLRYQDPVLRERIAFTLGLYCGHMKSGRLTESFAWQMGQRLDAVTQLDFRAKNPDRPANWYTAELTLKDGGTVRQDWWHLVDGDWGSGFFQSSACNFCDDVMAETADISFGDAWVAPYSSDGRGTNVVVVRDPALRVLLEDAIAEDRLDLQPVDADFLAATQAAGLRQRREGLAYRLTWAHHGIQPRKRVAPSRKLALKRRLIYRARSAISRWSHSAFWLSRRLGMPSLYLGWGRMALGIYHGVAYSRGPLGRLLDRLSVANTDG